MRQLGFNLIEDGDKYYELILLYNNWHQRTAHLSTGNTVVIEWKFLLQYCMNNKKETAHFYLDLIDLYNKQKKEKIREDNYVGFFNDIIFECFKDDINFPKFNKFVGGDFCQTQYKKYIEKYLNIKNKKSLYNFFKNIWKKI